MTRRLTGAYVEDDGRRTPGAVRVEVLSNGLLRDPDAPRAPWVLTREVIAADVTAVYLRSASGAWTFAPHADDLAALCRDAAQTYAAPSDPWTPPTAAWLTGAASVGPAAADTGACPACGSLGPATCGCIACAECDERFSPVPGGSETCGPCLDLASQEPPDAPIDCGYCGAVVPQMDDLDVNGRCPACARDFDNREPADLDGEPPVTVAERQQQAYLQKQEGRR